MNTLVRAALLAALLPVAAACSDEEALTLSSGPAPALEAEMFRSVLVDLTQPSHLPTAGDWPEDFGDANFYGPGLFYRYGRHGGNPLQIELAGQTHGYNKLLLEETLADVGKLMKKLEDVTMTLFGLMESQQYKADSSTVALLDKALPAINALARIMDYYPEGSGSVGGYGVDTYGPTTGNALMALLNLEYATTMGGTRKDTFLAEGLTILEKGRAKAFDDKLGYYRFSSTRSGLFLYPNVTQMMASLRAYELSGKQVYLDRAKDLHKAIQPLKVAGEGRYRSPYSAEYMGAKTNDYTTLSSQNYTMITFGLLYHVTKDVKYKSEITDILKFIRTHLLQHGRVLHHWMDGRLALPTDPEYYCSGCNLQLLYLIWRLEELLK